MTEWICNGVPQDGKQYPHSEAHEAHPNFGTDCEICGLPREAMNPTSNLRHKMPNKIILGVVGLLILGTIAAFVGRIVISDRCPSGTKKINQECIDPYLEVHNQAIQNGDSALAIIQRYRSVEDLKQAQNYLNLAITDLSSIPESALVYPQAQTKIDEYDGLAVQVGNVINNFQLCAIEPKPADCLF
jgi:hypothetical protein